MIIKVSGIAMSNFYNRDLSHRNSTHYYRPQQPKEKIKQDFDIMLDTEIKRLKFEKIC